MTSRCCIQYVSKSGRPSSGHRTGKGQFASQFQWRVVLKNMLIPIALFSHANKVMLKILHARFQDYVNQECPDVQAEFRKGRGTRDQSANICWIIEKAREFQKSIYLCFINYTKSLLLNHKKQTNKQLWKALKEMGISDHLTCPWETFMLVRKQQLEPLWNN